VSNQAWRRTTTAAPTTHSHASPSPATLRGDPPDPGRVLAECQRRDGSALLVSLRSYEGHRFVAIGVWSSGGYPIRGKHASVRLSELDDVAAALAEAIAIRDGGAL
jgi:hypothetical protein